MQLITNNINTLNNYRNNKSKINFKGYTLSSYRAHYDDNEIRKDSWAVPKNATPNYPGAYPNAHTKIYKADPFEIIPEEVYKTHDYTIRDDLRLSQIKKDYKNGYNNFAKNAWDEKEFLTSKLKENEPLFEKTKKLNNGYEKRLLFVKDDLTKQKLYDRKNINKNKLDYHANQKNALTNALKNANERFDLLKELDDMAGVKNSIIDEKNKTLYYIYDINKYSKEYDSLIKNKFKWGASVKSSYKKNLEKSDKRINDAINQGKTGEDLKKIIDKEIQSKQIERKYFVECRRDAAISIISFRKHLVQGKIDLPKLEEKLKVLTEKISKIDIELDKIMAKIEKFYKAKYPNWL